LGRGENPKLGFDHVKAFSASRGFDVWEKLGFDRVKAFSASQSATPPQHPQLGRSWASTLKKAVECESECSSQGFASGTLSLYNEIDVYNLRLQPGVINQKRSRL